MSTDRELLELAARAAGLAVCVQMPGGPFILKNGVCTHHWNPLTDDGDALRLAVSLGLWAPVRDAYQHLDSDGDPYAATRRAIVRAAAEIAKATGGAAPAIPAGRTSKGQE